MTLIHNFAIVNDIERLEILFFDESYRLPFCTSVNPSSSITGFGFAGL